MAGRFLLDTNVAIAILNRETGVAEKLADAETFLGAPIVGELFFGAYNSRNAAANIVRIEAFLEPFSVLICDEETGRHYGQIKADLRAKGRPIPENDLWIAALARQFDLTVLSRDMHFRELEGVSFEPL